MDTPIDQLAGVTHRSQGASDPNTIENPHVLRACLRQTHADIEFLLKTLEQRTDALAYAVGVVARIATERGMDECMAEDCTWHHPRCAVKIAQAEMAGKLGRWKT